MSTKKLPTVGKRYWLLDTTALRVVTVTVMRVQDWYPLFVDVRRGSRPDSVNLKHLYCTKQAAWMALHRFLEKEIEYHRTRAGNLAVMSFAVEQKIRGMQT